VISVARQRLKSIAFPLAEPSSVAYTVDGPDRARPYRVKTFRHEILSGKTPLFVFGQAAQTPFGSISGTEKQRIGARILAMLHA
jgi:hypothetical protein